MNDTMNIVFLYSSDIQPAHDTRILVRGTHSPYTVFRVYYPVEDEPAKYRPDYYVLEYELHNGDSRAVEPAAGGYWWVELDGLVERLTELEMQQRAFAEGVQG